MRKEVSILVLSLLVLGAGVVGSLGLYYYRILSQGALAQPPTYRLEVPASYIISRNGTYILASNSMGQVESVGTDAATVIQYAIDAVGVEGGGKIFLKNGGYDLANEIKIDYYDNIIIEGESWNTVLRTNNGSYNAIRFHGEQSNPNIGCVVRNLKIDGGANKQSTVADQQNGIITKYSQDCTFERLFITKMGRTGIYNTQFSHRNLIFNNFLYRNYRYGLSYTSSSRGRVIGNYIKEGYSIGMNWDATYGENYYTTIADNIFENNTYNDLFVVGGDSYSQSMYGTISGNTFRSGWSSGTNSFAAIKFDIAKYVTVVGNVFRINATRSGGRIFAIGASSDIVFTGNTIFSDKAYTVWEIWGGSSILIEGNQIYGGNGMSGVLLGDAHNVTICNNIFSGSMLAIGPNTDAASGSDIVIRNNDFDCQYKIGSRVLSDITNLVIEGNSGYATENQGVASGLGNGGTIAHGLVGTPDVVILTCLNSTYQGKPVLVYWNKAATTTASIVVNICWQDGTAITDTVIAVSWYAKIIPP